MEPPGPHGDRDNGAPMKGCPKTVAVRGTGADDGRPPGTQSWRERSTMRQWCANKIIWCAVWLCAFGVLPSHTVTAQVTDLCQQLAGQFAAGPPSLDPQSLMTLAQCVTTELAARVSRPEVSPESEFRNSTPLDTQPAVTPRTPSSSPNPPNVFPSAPVPSPEFTSPFIPPPDDIVRVPMPQGSASTPSRARGQWPPPYPWAHWPEQDTGFR